MYSESSDTYKGLAQEYEETHDRESWTVQNVDGTAIDDVLASLQVPVAIVDSSPYDTGDEVGVPDLFIDSLDELIMEPIFSMTDECDILMRLIKVNTPGKVLVSVSTYGCKYLVFKMKKFLLCRKTGRYPEYALYCQSRLVRKLIRDCEDHEIRCERPDNLSTDVYYAVDMPPYLIDRCPEIFSQGKIRTVHRPVTPIYRHGYTQYVHVDAVVTLYLTADKKKKVSRNRMGATYTPVKRKVGVLPLSISCQDDHATPLRDITNQDG